MLADDIIQPGKDLLETFRSLPWAVHGVVALALISGLVLWLHGRRVLKPMIVVVFVLIGAAIGFFVTPLTPLQGTISVYAGLFLGGAVGALLGALLYRFAMAVGLGLVLAVVAPVVAVVVLDAKLGAEQPDGTLTAEQLRLRGVGEAPPDQDHALSGDLLARGQKLRDSLKDAATRATSPLSAQEASDAITGSEPGAGAPPKSEDASTELLRTATERITAFLEALGSELASAWEALPPGTRVTLVGSASLGMGLGVLLGLFLPRWTAGAVTAMLGAAIWLPAGVWLIGATGTSWSESLHMSASTWLITWAAASVVGMLIQWRGLLRRKKKRAAVVSTA